MPFCTNSLSRPSVGQVANSLMLAQDLEYGRSERSCNSKNIRDRKARFSGGNSYQLVRSRRNAYLVGYIWPVLFIAALPVLRKSSAPAEGKPGPGLEHKRFSVGDHPDFLRVGTSNWYVQPVAYSCRLRMREHCQEARPKRMCRRCSGVKWQRCASSKTARPGRHCAETTTAPSKVSSESMFLDLFLMSRREIPTAGINKVHDLEKKGASLELSRLPFATPKRSRQANRSHTLPIELRLPREQATHRPATVQPTSSSDKPRRKTNASPLRPAHAPDLSPATTTRRPAGLGPAMTRGDPGDTL